MKIYCEAKLLPLSWWMPSSLCFILMFAGPLAFSAERGGQAPQSSAEKEAQNAQPAPSFSAEEAEPAFKPAATTTGQSDVEKIEVTGSRIKRIDIEGPSPIAIYTKEDIENSGYSSAGDFLRDTTVSHFGVSRETAGSSISGESFANLKGQKALILINGLRVAGDPTGEAVDLNLVPLYAIERIEVLKDGGSALYGADAVGGVINFITKKDFSGVELHGQIAPSFLKGGHRGDAASVFGGKKNNSSYVGSVGFRFQDAVENYERKWTNQTISPTGPYGVFNGEIDPNCPPELKTSSGCEFNVANYSTRLPQYSQLYSYFQGDYKLNETTLYTQWIGSYKNNKWDYAPVPGGVLLPKGHKMSRGAGAKGVLRYRFMEAGKRKTSFNNFIGDWTVGAKGWLSPSWDYDINLKLAHIIKNETQKGLLLREELSSAIVDGLYDPFDPSKRDLSKAKYTAKSNNDSSLIFTSANFSGEMDFMDLATGFQAYFKNYDQNADPKAKAGKILSNAGGDGYGDRYVLSYYLEGIKSFADMLEIQLAARADFYSDSVAQDPEEQASNQKGNIIKRLSESFKKRTHRPTINPKLAFRFKPSSKFLLRGSLSRAFVAPSLEALNQGKGEGYPFFMDTVACYTELAEKKAFDPVHNQLNDKTTEEKDNFVKDFLIDQRSVYYQKGLSKETKKELLALSKSLSSYEYCKKRQNFSSYSGNKNLKEETAWVASLGSHFQFTDEQSLTLDLWYIQTRNISSYGMNKKTIDAELKFGADHVKEKSNGSITIKRDRERLYNPLSGSPNHGITSKLLNLDYTRNAGLDLSLDLASQADILGGSPYIKNRLSYIFLYQSEGFKGLDLVNNIGKWGAPPWRNILTIGWQNSKHDISLSAYTTSPFAKESSKLENLPSYTRLDLDYQFIINSKTALKMGLSNPLFSQPPTDDETTETKVDHDIFEARGPFVFAGLKYKL